MKPEIGQYTAYYLEYSANENIDYLCMIDDGPHNSALIGTKEEVEKRARILFPGYQIYLAKIVSTIPKKREMRRLI